MISKIRTCLVAILAAATVVTSVPVYAADTKVDTNIETVENQPSDSEQIEENQSLQYFLFHPPRKQQFSVLPEFLRTDFLCTNNSGAALLHSELDFLLSAHCLMERMEFIQ